MSTWLGAIIETAGRADFWNIARKHGVEPATQEVRKHALISCNAGFDFAASMRLAEAMSRDLGSMALGFAVQTSVDVHDVRALRSGTLIRRLTYARDNDGWLHVDGTPQAWERAYFFEDAASTADGQDNLWPDMLEDDISDEDIARFEAAKRAGDASSIMSLLHPSSTGAIDRVCTFFDVSTNRPDGYWKKPSWLSRLFARRH